MKVASLFSGCGGLDLGLRRAGHDIVLQCEIDPICQSVLKKNFAGTLLCPDVCGIVELPLEIELLTAGFPCIDLSTAGLKAGIYGEHSGLWIHILRLVKKAIDNHRPVPWILCENVPGILNTYGRETTGVECLATEFERLGYNWCYRIVNSASFGTPVARRRFFFLASLHGDPRDVLLCRGRGKCLGGCSSSGLELGGEAEGDASSSSCRRKPCVECYMLNPTDPDFVLNLSRAHVPTPGIVPTVTASNAQHLCAVLSSQAQVGMLTAESVEALQGFPSGFTSLSSGLSLSEAASDRLRFGMLGNAVSVNTAEWLGNQLAQVYSQKYVMSGLDRPFPSNVYHNSEEYDSDDSVQPLTKEGFEVSWPGSAWFVKGLGRHCCECSECPVKTSLDSVASVLSCSIDKNDNDSDSRQRKKKLQRELRMYAKKLEPLGYQPDRLNESINRCGVGNAGPIQEKKKDAFIEVGDLVWAKIKSYPWWPGEVLNLDQYAITDLPSLIPARLLGSYMKYREKTGSRPEERKKQLCLVSFFGDGTFAWLEKGKLLSFEVNHERMMDNLLIANQLHNAKLQHAMKEAEAASQLRALQSSEEEEEVIAAGIDGIYEKDFLLSRYSHKSRASYLAAMAEKEDKCRSCAACLKVLKYHGLRDRKCLRNRAWAAAAAGHSGRFLSIVHSLFLF
jgi:site-specific DNA-cytosine methylase